MSKQTCDGCGIEHDPMDWHAEQLHDEYACVREALQTARSKLEQALEQREEALATGAELKVELAGVTGRLSSYRTRSIDRGELGSMCRLCKGSWSHMRGAEWHEEDCPNYTPVVERQNTK